ncbi:coiled-coil domain-containing protein-domain-containing protein [Amylocarpus encephaloides]|uniref:Coiled-coil domain-containing protein-domain-containing protein n=1 Tax=Amylocarpus encephaloides TaxID=45428 RepID=A0A9P8C3A2_9HELO|nr:coiled-coil domain-containing protein-domain-containing protein [Amylocarpus encephaloides]
MPHMQSPPPQNRETSSPLFSSHRQQTSPQIRIKNRRKIYLDRHPSYFTSPDLELINPLLYDRCVRKFQTPAEREADGRSKGYSGVLEADLYRSEAKLAALKKSKQAETETSVNDSSTQESSSSQNYLPFVSYSRGMKGEVLPEEEDEVPRDREEGFERWKFEMTIRFLKGDDLDFDYKEIDESDEWDVIERVEEEERWFEDEEPSWVDDKAGGETGGETGVQDF